MACDITVGRERGCKEQLGGTSKLYLINYLEDAFTVTTGEVTGLNVGLTEVFEYDIVGDGNTLVENMVSDRNTGTTVNTQTMTINLIGIDAATGVQMNLLAYGFPIAVIKDRNGIYHCVGISEGIDFTVDQNTGGARTDLSGYTLTGVSTEVALSPKMDATTVTDFEALVVPVP